MRKILFAIFCLTIGSVSAQDIHFSQLASTPIYLNPAQTGFFFARVRATANHRSQWRAVTVPFNTFTGAVDFKIYQNKYSRDIIGAGVMTYYDQAGDSKFGTTSGAFSLSYIKALNMFNNNFISFGVMVSYNDRSYDYTNLVFDNQFNGEYFDPGRYNGETFLYRGFNYVDYAAGIHWYYKVNDDISYNLGLSASHLATPEQSLLDDSDVKLDRKFVGYANAEIELPNKRVLSPLLYVAQQGTYTEIIAGSYIDLNTFSSSKGFSFVKAGLFFRPVDAAILALGMEYGAVEFGVSYDINYSGLRRASNLRGGFELSLIYLFDKKKKNKKKRIPCPDPF